MIFLAQRHCFPDSADLRVPGTKCLDVLRSYHNTSPTAVRCIKLLELSDRIITTRPTSADKADLQSREAIGHLPSPSSGQFEASVDVNDFHAFSSNIPAFSTPDLSQGQFDSVSDLWMDDHIDWAWLSTLPFDLDSEINGWSNL